MHDAANPPPDLVLELTTRDNVPLKVGLWKDGAILTVVFGALMYKSWGKHWPSVARRAYLHNAYFEHLVPVIDAAFRELSRET